MVGAGTGGGAWQIQRLVGDPIRAGWDHLRFLVGLPRGGGMAGPACAPRADVV